MVMVAKHFSDAKRICNEVWTCGVLLNATVDRTWMLQTPFK